MSGNSFPWPMDKPVEDFTNTGWYDGLTGFNKDVIDYFLTRLKLAEGALKDVYDIVDIGESTRDNAKIWCIVEPLHR